MIEILYLSILAQVLRRIFYTIININSQNTKERNILH